MVEFLDEILPTIFFFLLCYTLHLTNVIKDLKDRIKELEENAEKQNTEQTEKEKPRPTSSNNDLSG